MYALDLFNTTVNFQPITDYAIQIVGLVLTGILIWIGNSVRAYLDAKFNLKNSQFEDSLQQRYNEAIMRSMAYAESTVKGATPKEADVHNVFVKTAADYMIKMFPQLVKDMPPEKVAESVISRLPSPIAEKADAVTIAKAGATAVVPVAK